MQELRFVGLEDDWLIATNDNGERFRLRADESLREALRPRPAARPEGPRVPPRQIQQLIRAGRTVDEVVELTGADSETVERFEGPILAERGYIVEQARGVAVRLQSQIDPLSREGATFGTTIDDRLEQLGAKDVRWDAWKDPETGWHVGLNFVTEDVSRNALWTFDSRAHSLHPSSPAAVTLSQQGEPSSLMGPHLRAVKRDPTDRVIPLDSFETATEELSTPTDQDLTTHETADLLEALRRRRGERQHATYEEEAEFSVTDSGSNEAADVESSGSGSERVTPFARPRTTAADAGADRGNAAAPGNSASGDSASGDGASGDRAPWASVSGNSATGDSVSGDSTADDATGHMNSAHRADKPEPSDKSAQVPLDTLEPAEAPRGARGKAGRKRGGRPSMPSWDEIVFGTKGDDE
ncbi:septation protein SepH [Gulosibacter molinativorax]|uniref:DUF3071 domain-containing protein n=1 Tax=Gulosibacter molinativorax TaxID=256821 RepID=A0ABT7C5M2_9MICO|nr:septation protein SepH [Gulosibacter molinativorax]MDJ1370449.1 DUF3071 domain-containing protein [Gulosibacter molinativorax]QUY61362.1 DNA-binding protein [Gulosibacter molinativorax]